MMSWAAKTGPLTQHLALNGWPFGPLMRWMQAKQAPTPQIMWRSMDIQPGMPVPVARIATAFKRPSRIRETRSSPSLKIGMIIPLEVTPVYRMFLPLAFRLVSIPLRALVAGFPADARTKILPVPYFCYLYRVLPNSLYFPQSLKKVHVHRAAVGFLAIKLFKWLLKTNKMFIFILYTAAVGLTIILISIIELSSGTNLFTQQPLHF